MLVLLLFPIILFASGTIATKKYQSDVGTGDFQAAYYNLINSGFSFLILLMIKKFSIFFTTYTLICAIIAGSLLVVYRVVMIKAAGTGLLVIITMSYVLGGTILPFLFGILFLGESLSFMKIIGLLLVITSFLPILRKQEVSATIPYKFYFFCFILFIINGVFLILSKVVQQTAPKQYAIDYITLYTFFYFLSSIVNLIFAGKHADKNTLLSVFTLRSAISSIYASVTNSAGNIINLILSYSIAASVQFPILNSGIMVLVTILAFILYKERPTRTAVLSLLLAILSIVFLTL